MKRTSIKKLLRRHEPNASRDFVVGVAGVLALVMFFRSGLIPEQVADLLGLLAIGGFLYAYALFLSWEPRDNSPPSFSDALSTASCPECGGRPKNYWEVGMFYRRWLCRCDRCNREWRLNLPAN